MRRVALAVGDTPGHFFPAMAVAVAYSKRVPDAEIRFFGPDNAARNLAAQYGWPYHTVQGGQFARANIVTRLRSALSTSIGILNARQMMRLHRIELVIGFGAYSSAVGVLAGKTLGALTAISEGNAHVGIANRLLARMVDRIYLGQLAAGNASDDQTLVTGWPIREEIAALENCQRTHVPGRLRMLVCSGSRGGSFFVDRIPALLVQLRATGLAVSVRHQCADLPPESIRALYEKFGIDAEVSGFVADIASAYRWADFAIARAGAGTLAELAAAALPSVIVPLGDAAEDHQSSNAERYAQAGAGLCVGEHEWNPAKVAREVAHIISDPQRWKSVSMSAASLAVLNAAAVIVDDCERILKKGEI